MSQNTSFWGIFGVFFKIANVPFLYASHFFANKYFLLVFPEYVLFYNVIQLRKKYSVYL